MTEDQIFGAILGISGVAVVIYCGARLGDLWDWHKQYRKGISGLTYRDSIAAYKQQYSNNIVLGIAIFITFSALEAGLIVFLMGVVICLAIYTRPHYLFFSDFNEAQEEVIANQEREKQQHDYAKQQENARRYQEETKRNKQREKASNSQNSDEFSYRKEKFNDPNEGRFDDDRFESPRYKAKYEAMWKGYDEPTGDPSEQGKQYTFIRQADLGKQKGIKPWKPRNK